MTVIYNSNTPRASLVDDSGTKPRTTAFDREAKPRPAAEPAPVVTPKIDVDAVVINAKEESLSVSATYRRPVPVAIAASTSVSAPQPVSTSPVNDQPVTSSVGSGKSFAVSDAVAPSPSSDGKPKSSSEG